VGAAVGAGLGAASGTAAGSGGTTGTGTGGSYGGPSRHTVIGAFDDTATAERAIERLTQSGFDRDDVHLQHKASDDPQQEQHESSGSKGGFFARLFGMDDDYPQESRTQQNQYAGHASTYDEAVRRGSAVVVVDAHDEPQADRASALLHELGAIDVDERSRQWRAEGWQAPHAGATGTQQNLAAGRDTRANVGEQGKLDVVEEELQVGKRTLERGGVRVIQRVSSKPVRELVRLREERAVVDRRPVDRPATPQDLSNFKEGTLEVRETVEEPVVAKTARVVEEVRVGKEVREHEETIEDTVRRKDVEVERLAGGQTGRVTERERAVASEDPLKRRNPNDKDRPL
jgi:uncharacterized protein (TIGR02271 family)